MKSQHGTEIALDETYSMLCGAPLEINGKASKSENPDRYKQHGFHFNADNCIACHACESASSEKKDSPRIWPIGRSERLKGAAITMPRASIFRWPVITVKIRFA